MPAPASALGIFKPTLDPTAHTIPDGAGLCWRQIGHDQPHLLIALIPACQQCTPQAAALPRETVHHATPGTAHVGRGGGQTAKRAFSLWTEMALFVDAHERVPAQRDDLAVEPRCVQAAITHHDHRPMLRHAVRELLE